MTAIIAAFSFAETRINEWVVDFSETYETFSQDETAQKSGVAHLQMSYEGPITIELLKEIYLCLESGLMREATINKFAIVCSAFTGKQPDFSTRLQGTYCFYR